MSINRQVLFHSAGFVYVIFRWKIGFTNFNFHHVWVHITIPELRLSMVQLLIVLCMYFNPMTAVPPMTSLSLCSTYDVKAFWLCVTSAGGKDLSNDTQIKVISSMEPDICMKNACSEIWVKNSKQNFLPLHVATPWEKCQSRWCFLGSF